MLDPTWTKQKGYGHAIEILSKIDKDEMSKRRTAKGITELVMSGDEKKKYGCIVTFSDGTSKHFIGEKYLQQMADFADQLEVKVSTISTPATIFRDLQGTRKPFESKHRQLRDIIHTPESAMVAQIKRQDLI